MPQSDFNELVDSYMPVTLILMVTRSELEMCLLRALRIERRCESCRWSRAPHNLERIARDRGVLPIYQRRCIRHGTGKSCRDWERIEIPQEILEDA